ncbi:uncharacterized protein LOC114575383 isoform X2 [Exaiptasia diaphana]|uniref:Uncharacterized protein n=1 Tax=Exaiptasia diaphana TaxID=2652724 RepID=A0A913YN64_EXADI|nr:uncharacterized protein LOC114575383 isoform X2 [Exaiptasia diaphana]
MSTLSLLKQCRRVSNNYHMARQINTARLLNPIPYFAEYFGHKLHLDQNEKLCKGVPNERACDYKRTGVIPSHVIPTVEAASDIEYIYIFRNAGGKLQVDSSFGSDPLARNKEKSSARDTQFAKFYSFTQIFHDGSNGNTELFKNGLLYYIYLTEEITKRG